MLSTLVEKEVTHHVLSVRFVVLLMMCFLLVPLTLSINYQKHLQHRVDHQESVKLANIGEVTVNPMMPLDPKTEVTKLFLKPTVLSTFANGLEEVLPSYLGITRNGIVEGPPRVVSSSLSYIFGSLDFLFVVGVVFSLLALLFTFDAIAGEREAGTLRITLANTIPRNIFLWSKFIGGYFVLVTPFLMSFLGGILLLVWRGFPLGELDIFPRVICLLLVSLLYISVFLAIGLVISTYVESSKTALIVAFTFWVFAVLILPRAGFIAAKIMSPTRTAQSVYMEKAIMRDDFESELSEKKRKLLLEISSGSPTTKDLQELDRQIKPLEETYRQRFQDLSSKIDRGYQREKASEELMGEMLSRVTPTASLNYLATALTETGKIKRLNYLQAGKRYYEQVDSDLFRQISDHLSIRHINPADAIKLTVPPPLEATTLAETFHLSVVDVILLCFFLVGLTTIAFLKFFKTDI